MQYFEIGIEERFTENNFILKIDLFRRDNNVLCIVENGAEGTFKAEMHGLYKGSEWEDLLQIVTDKIIETLKDNK